MKLANRLGSRPSMLTSRASSDRPFNRPSMVTGRASSNRRSSGRVSTNSSSDQPFNRPSMIAARPSMIAARASAKKEICMGTALHALHWQWPFANRSSLGSRCNLGWVASFGSHCLAHGSGVIARLIAPFISEPFELRSSSISSCVAAAAASIIELWRRCFLSLLLIRSSSFGDVASFHCC